MSADFFETIYADKPLEECNGGHPFVVSWYVVVVDNMLFSCIALPLWKSLKGILTFELSGGT